MAITQKKNATISPDRAENPDAIADTVLDEGAVVLRDDRRQTQVLEPEPDLQPRLPAWPMLRRKQKRKKAVKVQ